MKITFGILVNLLAFGYSKTITVNEGESIQKALEEVQPGDTIQIGDGTYMEDLETVTDGQIEIESQSLGLGRLS